MPSVTGARIVSDVAATDAWMILETPSIPDIISQCAKDSVVALLKPILTPC
jgi:hypothetical protein